MALELEGKIVQKLTPASGTSARGVWARQDFILEYMDGQYPTSVCFTAWGQDKVQDLQKYAVGDAVKVSFNVKGREYNGRWYNDLRIWKLAPAGAAAPAAPAPDAWQQPAPPVYQAPPAPSFEDMPPADPMGEEDLPF